LWRNPELEDRVLLPINGLHIDRCRLIHKGLRDLANQFGD
jgi:hypothetical protein